MEQACIQVRHWPHVPAQRRAVIGNPRSIGKVRDRWLNWEGCYGRTRSTGVVSTMRKGCRRRDSTEPSPSCGSCVSLTIRLRVETRWQTDYGPQQTAKLQKKDQKWEVNYGLRSEIMSLGGPCSQNTCCSMTSAVFLAVLNLGNGMFGSFGKPINNSKYDCVTIRGW